jgi:hypothetical protein
MQFDILYMKFVFIVKNIPKPMKNALFFKVLLKYFFQIEMNWQKMFWNARRLEGSMKRTRGPNHFKI